MEGKVTAWDEVIEKFFCEFYPASCDGEEEMLDADDDKEPDPLEFITRMDDISKKYRKMDVKTKNALLKLWINKSWITIDAADITPGDKNNNNDNNVVLNFTPPNKNECTAEKFVVIKYTLGPNEEYFAVSTNRREAWERNQESVSHIFREFLQRKVEGWIVTRTKE
ncbi:hypothetical protein Tco_0145082 [Tanacetum coccineum]